MSTGELFEPFDRMLAGLFTPQRVREIEQGADWRGDWEEIAQSGFLDALVAETSDGFGLPFADVSTLFMALGDRVVPLPIGETMIARAILANAGAEVPTGSIAIATGGAEIALGGVADAVLGLGDRNIWLATAVEGEPQSSGSLGQLNIWATPELAHGADAIAGDPTWARSAVSLLRAAQIAGAGNRSLEMAIAHANDRVQFGKPIGRQQAIQQQLAVMAEQCVALRLAVEQASAHADAPASHSTQAAMALACQYAPEIANCGHAVHGAIGMSEEFDLQLYSRRLISWSRSDGGYIQSAQMLGKAALDSGDTPVDWIRCNL